MKVLVFCECSGVVRRAFRRLGHDAWSCDIKPAEDGDTHHILSGGTDEETDRILAMGWHLGILHPPCTFLCNSGVKHLYSRFPQEANRWNEMKQGAAFFQRCLDAPIPHLCVENPVMHKHAKSLINFSGFIMQSIQPFEFGDPESKRTCFWLRGLPPLFKTHAPAMADEAVLFPELHTRQPDNGRWANQAPSGAPKSGGPNASRIRAKTYGGVATAMAEQWSRALKPLQTLNGIGAKKDEDFC